MSKLLVLSKQEQFRRLMHEGATCVRVDPRRVGVVVPNEYTKQVTLVLVFGYTLPKPTDDVVADKTQISATLSFNQEPYKVILPWSAVYAITDMEGDGVIWAEDVPDELRERADEGEQEARSVATDEGKKRKFSVIDGDANRPIAVANTRKV